MKRLWLSLSGLAAILLTWSVYVFLHVHHHIQRDHTTRTRASSSSTAAVTIADSESDLEMLESLNHTLTILNDKLARLAKHSTSKSRRASTSTPISASNNVANTHRDTIVTDVSLSQRVTELAGKKGKSRMKALLFTMDSISSYEQNSASGGAAGEIIIRKSLEYAFQYFGCQLTVLRSDHEFERSNPSAYDIVLLDPWTWAAKGWVPKQNIRGLDDRIYFLDFFGSKRLRGSGLSVPPSRFLTAFDTPGNQFLGYMYHMSSSTNSLSLNRNNGIHSNSTHKRQQGVVWAKDPRHFEHPGRTDMVRYVADLAPLVSTAAPAPGLFAHRGVTWVGHQSSAQWQTLLSESKFLLGLGHPLLGPSAIDAMSQGCMYLNPRKLRHEVQGNVFTSQHPYAEMHIGEPYVCSFDVDDREQLQACVKKALESNLEPKIPEDFTEEAYLERVNKIFRLVE